MRIVQSKKRCTMSQAQNPSAETIRQSRDFAVSQRNLYYRYASLIFRRWRDWTGRPEFYFIPLDLEMEYVLSTGLTLRPGSGPCFLGSLLRLRHSYPELFNATCPEGHPAYTYRFAGSPLSGRVTLDLVCPDCGFPYASLMLELNKGSKKVPQKLFWGTFSLFLHDGCTTKE